jgi:hypothetical protein
LNFRHRSVNLLRADGDGIRLTHRPEPIAISEAQVVTRATVIAAERLQLSTGTLAGALGVSEAAVLQMARLDHVLQKGSEPFERAVLLLRLFRSLTALAGGDEAVPRSWLLSKNTAIGAIPAQKILSRAGLNEVVAYLENQPALA